MDHDQERRRAVIAEARRTCERLQREQRRDLIFKVRTTAAGWTPRPPEEPVKPEPRLDTLPSELTSCLHVADSGPAELDDFLREVLAGAFAHERRATVELSDQVHELRIEVAKLTSELAVMREARALDRAATLDLPPLPRRVN